VVELDVVLIPAIGFWLQEFSQRVRRSLARSRTQLLVPKPSARDGDCPTVALPSAAFELSQDCGAALEPWRNLFHIRQLIAHEGQN
jgi:hypothetical protein